MGSDPKHEHSMAYAIVKIGGLQYRVQEGDRLQVERVVREPGAEVEFTQVLLASTNGSVRVGQPYVADAKVVTQVVRQLKGPKLIHYKFTRREGFHRKVGHRQQLTELRVKSLVC